jgi:hypothetical protein
MINIFFYNKLKEAEMIYKISKNVVIRDGYIIVQKYNTKTNTLLLGDSSSRTEMLQGKIVSFHLTWEHIMDKLNNIHEIRIPFKPKYNMEIIDVILQDDRCVPFSKEKAYIIY